MFCPKCSQQQLSSDVRFCPRCGFQLEVVKELVAESSDALAVTDRSGVQRKFFTQRKQDLLVGATFTYVAAVMTVLYSWVQPKGVLIVPLG